jgi:hypothetical protein
MMIDFAWFRSLSLLTTQRSTNLPTLTATSSSARPRYVQLVNSQQQPEEHILNFPSPLHERDFQVEDQQSQIQAASQLQAAQQASAQAQQQGAFTEDGPKSLEDLMAEASVGDKADE